ncbi:UDP-glucose 4-epimerase family protein [Pseudomonas kitaguniensis]|uniref:UDP-glucose 4-epimerase family protein n=1 Tax=Pseudomonas kitaguniensis TaxID=2607908 RepID=UPI003CFE12DB
MRVLITGASGFVGGRLVNVLAQKTSFELFAAARREILNCPATVRIVEDFSSQADVAAAVEGMDVVVHSAARVHVMNDSSVNPLDAFRKVNVEGTLNLARAAVSAGVKRFVFISSIKVNGEGTPKGVPYCAGDTPAPMDPYGVSKLEAEEALRELAASTHLEVVIIRPVLVYGPGVKANFLNMMRWMEKGIPLPFGAIHNLRSLVSIDNLVDLISVCIEHPAAANQTFLVSDGEDVSTTQLLRKMANALDKKSSLLAVPSFLLEAGALLIGKKSLSQRLCGSLQVDITKTRNLLGWTPPVSVDQALRDTASAFKEQRK